MNLRILLVDDHTLVRKGFRALLLTHYPDWEIREADNGVQAILACSTEKQDMVIMDHDMPKLDGANAARQILKQHPGTRVLIVTMHNGAELVETMWESGVTGLINKDCTDEEFMHAITQVRLGVRHFPTHPRNMPAHSARKSSREAKHLHGLNALTPREAEIFRLLAAGHQPATIATTLSISQKTLDTHKMSIFRKCGLHSIPELVRFAFLNNAT